MVQSRRDVERGLWYSGKIGVIFLVSRNPDRKHGYELREISAEAL